MKKIILSVLVFGLMSSCSSSTNLADSSSNQSTDPAYGFTEKKPVKVGGVNNGPINERNYLNSLSGPNGEVVSFNRLGSCCPFNTKNASIGGGMLDKYLVSYEGKKDSVVLYLNMYDAGKLTAPVGFKMK